MGARCQPVQPPPNRSDPSASPAARPRCPPRLLPSHLKTSFLISNAVSFPSEHPAKPASALYQNLHFSSTEERAESLFLLPLTSIIVRKNDSVRQALEVEVAVLIFCNCFYPDASRVCALGNISDKIFFFSFLIYLSFNGFRDEIGLG